MAMFTLEFPLFPCNDAHLCGARLGGIKRAGSFVAPRLRYLFCIRHHLLFEHLLDAPVPLREQC